MKWIRHILPIVVLALAACQSANSTPPPSSRAALPTVTPGMVIHGVVSTPLAGPGEAIDNPATVQARFSQPTATPDTSACPTPDTSVELEGTLPDSEGERVNAIANYLNTGGTAEALESALADEWNVLEPDGFVQADTDLTGEGTPEIIISQRVDVDASLLLILGCSNGRYVVRYQTSATDADPPQIIQITDLNANGVPDVLYVFPTCEDVEILDTCEYHTQLISWQPSLNRFASILGAEIVYTGWPDVVDMDNDQVSELVLPLDNRGNAETGPLRTGVNIYDWNGTLYVLSIVRLDPVRYRIQVLHQADKYLLDSEPSLAFGLYQRALDDDSLRAWRGDESIALQAYSLYRLLLARAALNDPVLIEVMQTIDQRFPDNEQVYIEMARGFWDAFSVSGDLSAGCVAVQEVISRRPEAVDLLNQYGERSPTYEAHDLCPF